MAEVKVYRVAYTYDVAEGAGIIFSVWVEAGGEDEILASIPKHYTGGTSPVEAEPTIIGWEEKTLDDDPF